MPGLLRSIARPFRRRWLWLALLLMLAGCSALPGGKPRTPPNVGELFQTQVDRFASLGMRSNLESLDRLAGKLYLRNPREWRKTGLPDADSARRAVMTAIDLHRPPPALGGRQDIVALDYALSSDFAGDRVGAFIYALGSMLITAHGGRSEFYLTDSLDVRFIHNAARNVEKAAWMLATRRDSQGHKLLLANEISEQGRNLSFATEFAKIVARLDMLTDVLDERYRRIGVNYAHGLLFLNFLPVQ